MYKVNFAEMGQTMNFSIFANLLYSYNGKGQAYSDYVLFLTNLIMRDPSSKIEIEDEEDDKYNPLRDLPSEDSNALENHPKEYFDNDYMRRAS
ncbi:MAG: hypothetical protein ACYDG2_16145 [Ruminiclostridium sp.]